MGGDRPLEFTARIVARSYIYEFNCEDFRKVARKVLVEAFVPVEKLIWDSSDFVEVILGKIDCEGEEKSIPAYKLDYLECFVLRF